MSKAVHIKSPLVDAGKKSRPYLQYALDAADNRVNFYLVSIGIVHDSRPLCAHVIVTDYSSHIAEHRLNGLSLSCSSFSM